MSKEWITNEIKKLEPNGVYMIEVYVKSYGVIIQQKLRFIEASRKTQGLEPLNLTLLCFEKGSMALIEPDDVLPKLTEMVIDKMIENERKP